MIDALLKLGEPERSAVTLRYLEGLSYAQVAARQSVNEAACRKRVSRGIAQLRAQLDQRQGGRAAWAAVAGSWAVHSPGPAAPAATSIAAATSKTAAGSGMLAMKGSTKGLAVAAALLLISMAAYQLLQAPTGSGVVLEGQPATPAALDATAQDAVSTPEIERTRPRDELVSSVEAGPREALSMAAFPVRDERIAGTLLLRVRWSDGTPAAGITAKILPWGDPNARQRRQWVVTDEEGEVTVAGLSAGRVGIYLDRQGGGSAEVSAGEVTVAEREIPLGFEVTGRVLDPSGQPVPGATIVLSDYGNDGEVQTVARSDASGDYRLRDVGEGRSLSSRASGFAPSIFHRLAGIEPGSTKELDLVLREGSGELAGVVVDEAGVPIRGALMRLSLPRPEDRSENLHPIKFKSAEDGTFRLDDLGVGSAMLTVATEAHVMRTVPVDIGPREIQQGTAREQDARDLRIVMVLGGSLSGTVRRMDGSPAAGAAISWKPGPRHARSHRRTTTADAQGRYRLDGLPAGLLDFTANKREQGKSMGQARIKLRETSSWNPQLIAGRTIRGRVVDAQGSPLAGWMVGTQTGRGLWDRREKTNADGAFALANVRSDAVDLHVSTANIRVGTLLTRSMAGVDEDGFLEIVVPDDVRPRSTVRCRVLVDGKPPEPAATVHVATAGHGFRDAFSGKDGEVEIEWLRAGTATLTVAAEGYAELTRVVELEPSAVYDAGVIALVRGGKIKASFSLPEGVAGEAVSLPGQATIYDQRGKIVTFFDLEDGVGTSEGIHPGEYEVRANTMGRLASPLLARVVNGELTEVEALIEPGNGARALVVRADGERPASPFLYRVTDSAGREVVALTSDYAIPMQGSHDLHVWVSSLPKGSLTLHVTDANGASGEVAFEVLSVGYSYLKLNDPNRHLRVELTRRE